MIRFIDLGRQIAVNEDDETWPHQFAFYDTVADKFIEINGSEVFDSLGDLVQEMEQDESMTEYYATRLVSLTPDWVRTVPAPRNNHVVWGIKG